MMTPTIAPLDAAYATSPGIGPRFCPKVRNTTLSSGSSSPLGCRYCFENSRANRIAARVFTAKCRSRRVSVISVSGPSQPLLRVVADQDLYLAERFVHYGAKVHLAARRGAVLRAKQRELAEIGLCEYVTADIGTVAGIRQLATAYAERERSLDILVNNAGISGGGREIEDMTEKTWDSVIHLNLKSVFFMIQAFLPYIRVGPRARTA